MARITDYLKRMLTDSLEQGEPALPPLEAGSRALAEGRWAEALEHFTAVLDDAPDELDALLGAGRSHMRLGRPGAARACFQRALAQLSRPHAEARAAEVLVLIGEAESAAGDAAAAEQTFRSAITRYDRCTDAFIRLGILLYDQRRLADALEVLNRAVFLDRHAGVARYYLARTCLTLGDFRRARAQIHLLLKVKPGFAPGHMVAALASEQLGDYRQVVVELERVIELGGADDEVYFRLGEAQLRLRAKERALAAFAEVGPRHRDYAAAQLRIARLHEDACKYMLALAAYHNLLSYADHHAEARAAVTRIIARLRDIDASLANVA